METIIPLIIQAISGAAGGGIVGNLVKSAGMTLLPKLIAGAVGGVGGNAALGGIIGPLLGAAAGGGLDISSIISQVSVRRHWRRRIDRNRRPRDECDEEVILRFDFFERAGHIPPVSF